jgi:hypothetical protein
MEWRLKNTVLTFSLPLPLPPSLPVRTDGLIEQRNKARERRDQSAKRKIELVVSSFNLI